MASGEPLCVKNSLWSKELRESQELFRHRELPTPPISGNKAMEDVACYDGPKGNLYFPLEKPIPLDPIERIVKRRLKQDNEKVMGKRAKNTEPRKSK